jgi:hypothetical protein
MFGHGEKQCNRFTVTAAAHPSIDLLRNLQSIYCGCCCSPCNRFTVTAAAHRAIDLL